MRETTITATPPVDLGRATRLLPVALGGGAVLLAFFGGLGSWAATAPLAGAAVAPAVVAPEGHRKTVQHLEGGIVREILVREGDLVAAGQALVRLDDIPTRAEAAELEARWYATQAALARLAAEERGSRTVELDAELSAAAMASPAVAAAVAGEAEQLATRRAALEGHVTVLERRVEKERRAIEGLKAEAASYEQQRRYVEEELRSVTRLYEQGLERKPRLLALQRDRSQLDGSIATARAGTGRSREAIAEAQAEMASLRQERAAEVAKAATAARIEAGALAEKLKAARDRLGRTAVLAPVAGTVVELKVRTTGGVIGAGEPILDLVPAGDELVLEARVSPNDIDEVATDSRVQVHLTAYRTRHLPRLEGVVRQVSADRLTDQATQQPYYAARITVDRGELERLGAGVALTPGMPAEALIVTRERTLLDYLLAPVADVFRRGMRES
jgi:HlyD family type I secretion membrane fusion protein